ncbi:WD40 repeat domain-containing protein [Streptomyces sp. NBC_01408]|uniref:WD40 repeat domain-containing protein n=1 Tax=Streptomyces sp. NBC_01408 TaxID=2903855 RepID=UPI00225B2E41|nr:WD40 repeat domain-containing protein [Streptomyces sp. NBC_01408]MCX4695744.1 WD40 repeat domain-containing protein [Streptomyces sp. NBC_01408]
MIKHTSPISGIDARGDLVVTAGYDNRIILWNARTRTAITEARHDHLANQCRFSPSGRIVVTSSSDYSARLWSVPDLRLISVLTDQKDDVEMTVVSPDETRVATASRDHIARIYDLDGRLIHRLEGHEEDVLSVEWVRGGAELVTTSDDGTVRRWDAATGALLSTIDLGDVETDTVAVLGVDSFALGNDEGELILIDPSGTRRHRVHDAGIKRIAYDAEAGILLSSSYDRTVRLWRLEHGADPVHLLTSEVPADVWLRSCAKLDATRWVFGTFGSSYAVFDRADGSWDLTSVTPTPGLNAVTDTPTGRFTVGDSGTVRRDGEPVAELGSCCNFITPVAGTVVSGGQLGALYDATTGALLYQHRSPLNCAAVHTASDGETLVVGTYTGEAIVLRDEKGTGRLELVGEHRIQDNAIKGVAIQGDVLFSVCATGTAKWHSLPDLKPVADNEAAHARIANGAAALPDGRFASVSRDLTLRIWTAAGEQQAVVTTPHLNSIKCVAVDPHTSLIATGGYHGQVAVYDPEACEWVCDTRPTPAGISALAPGGGPGRFLASSYDGCVYEIAVDTAAGRTAAGQDGR